MSDPIEGDEPTLTDAEREALCDATPRDDAAWPRVWHAVERILADRARPAPAATPRPDWWTRSEDQAIEHVRDGEAPTDTAAQAEAWDRCVREVAVADPRAIFNPYRNGAKS